MVEDEDEEDDDEEADAEDEKSAATLAFSCIILYRNRRKGPFKANSFCCFFFDCCRCGDLACVPFLPPPRPPRPATLAPRPRPRAFLKPRFFFGCRAGWLTARAFDSVGKLTAGGGRTGDLPEARVRTGESDEGRDRDVDRS